MPLLLLAAADLTSILKDIENPTAQRQLIHLARSGDPAAQWEAARLSRKGQLGSLDPKLADAWFQKALSRKHPPACLDAALERLDVKKDPEPWLRCAATAGLPEGQYLLGRWILNQIAAEDEPLRFEGLAWVALSAKSGYGPAQRRWDILVAELVPEDLERVEQTTKKLL